MFELKNIEYSIIENGQKKCILGPISCQFLPGELVVITGPNGSGKSTLAQIMMGIKKPTAGRIFWCNEDITDKTITERARSGIAFSFQQPVKMKGITVYEMIDIAMGGGTDPKEIQNYLKTVGLSPEKYLAREVDAGLSGGELKRIELASVLARESRMAVFDEPEAGIDLWSFDNLTTVFKKLQAEKSERTLIVISHQEKILKIADRIMLIEAGRVKRFGEASEVLADVVGRSK